MVSGEIKKGEVYLYWIGKKETQGTVIKKIRPGVVISKENSRCLHCSNDILDRVLLWKIPKFCQH